jgi:mRNA-degrading endonuclease RelE of RelBE toxin-antitoxin system
MEFSSNWPMNPSWKRGIEKWLRPNKTAEWEVRIDGFRVFYDADADQEIVDGKVVGLKVGSKVCVRGREFKV